MQKSRKGRDRVSYSSAIFLLLSPLSSPPLSLYLFSTLWPQKLRALPRAAAQREQHPVGPRVAGRELPSRAGAVSRGLIHKQETRRRRPSVAGRAAGLARRARRGVTEIVVDDQRSDGHVGRRDPPGRRREARRGGGRAAAEAGAAAGGDEASGGLGFFFVVDFVGSGSSGFFPRLCASRRPEVDDGRHAAVRPCGRRYGRSPIERRGRERKRRAGAAGEGRRRRRR